MVDSVGGLCPAPFAGSSPAPGACCFVSYCLKVENMSYSSPDINKISMDKEKDKKWSPGVIAYGKEGVSIDFEFETNSTEEEYTQPYRSIELLFEYNKSTVNFYDVRFKKFPDSPWEVKANVFVA